MWLISSESMKFSDIFATGVLGLLVMSFGCDEAAAAVHSITDYGAVSDTTQLSTELYSGLLTHARLPEAEQ